MTYELLRTASYVPEDGQAVLSEQPRARSCRATEGCKNPSLDSLWMYGVTVSLGRICHDYRNKSA